MTTTAGAAPGTILFKVSQEASACSFKLHFNEANIPSRDKHGQAAKPCSAVVTHLSSQWESHCSCQVLPARRQIITRQVSNALIS